MQPQVHLQGIGKHDAVPASRLSAKMLIVYNYGSTAEVLSTKPSPSGKTIKVVTRGTDGREYSKRYDADRLVAAKIRVKLCKGCIEELREYNPYLVSRVNLLITEVPVKDCDNSNL